MTKISYRELEEKDIDILLEIEETFPNPWPKEAFFLEFEGQHNKSLGLEIDDELVGYMFYSSYFDEVNINHFAIAKDQRKKGYASLILQELLKKISKKQLLYLEVSTENKAAINLYKKHGLEIVRTRKNYYGQNQDAYIMQKNRKESI